MLDDFILEIVDGIAIQKVNMVRVTIKEVKEFKDSIESLIINGHKNIIIDFSECHYIESIIVGVMITFVKELRSTSGDMKLMIPPEGNILNIFAQMGLNKIFSQFSSKELAIASFTKKV